MKRRRLFAWLALGSSLPRLAAGQTPTTRPRRVALLDFSPSNPSLHAALRRAMAAHGWTEGQGVEYRVLSAEGREDRVAAAVAELLAWSPDVVATSSAVTTHALQRATRTLPIVMMYVVNPVGNGFATSLARPGGNITGMSNQQEDLLPKLAELMHELLPRMRRLGFLLNPGNPQHGAYRAAARRAATARGLEGEWLSAGSGAQIVEAVERARTLRVEGLAVLADPLFTGHAEELARQLALARLPAIYGQRIHVLRGGLMSYGASIEDSWRRAAQYIDRILRGRPPGELPIEQPTRFELVINRKVAAALGITLPPTLLLRADEVIE